MVGPYVGIEQPILAYAASLIDLVAERRIQFRRTAGRTYIHVCCLGLSFTIGDKVFVPFFIIALNSFPGIFIFFFATKTRSITPYKKISLAYFKGCQLSTMRQFSRHPCTGALSY